MSEPSLTKPTGRYIERARAFQTIYSLFFAKVASTKALATAYGTCIYADPSTAAQDVHEEGSEEVIASIKFEEGYEVSSESLEEDQGLPPLSSLKDDDIDIFTPERGVSHADGFGWELVLGVWQKQKDLDKSISEYSQHWRIDRMGKVELALLRLAMYELLFRDDIPTKVIINEAVELSKKYSDENSRGFINGILDAITKSISAGTTKRQTYFWNQQ